MRRKLRNSFVIFSNNFSHLSTYLYYFTYPSTSTTINIFPEYILDCVGILIALANHLEFRYLFKTMSSFIGRILLKCHWSFLQLNNSLFLLEFNYVRFVLNFREQHLSSGKKKYMGRYTVVLAQQNPELIITRNNILQQLSATAIFLKG